MVINWKKQIDDCIEQGQIMPIFHATPIEKRFQNYCITKRLISLGYDKNQILQWFLTADEDNFMTIEDVEELIKNSKHRNLPKEHEFTIYITQKEIDFVNNLETTYECKKFLLSLVCFVKFMRIKTGLPILNNRDRSMVYYGSCGRDEYSSKHRGIEMNKFVHWMLRNKIVTSKQKESEFKKYTGHRGGKKEYKSNTIVTANWIDYDATEGILITDFLTQVPNLCQTHVHPNTRICTKCGKKFVISTKTKRTLCEECYHDVIKSKDRERKKTI